MKVNLWAGGGSGQLLSLLWPGKPRQLSGRLRQALLSVAKSWPKLSARGVDSLLPPPLGGTQIGERGPQSSRRLEKRGTTVE